ncbi:tyrosine-type recombinase/integrase [Metallosphaera sedula]|uniref:tyrosine-type recombinase/integrase n=1 Tax=Metallosphaera sedula TaxID=43687 RepID=UPI0020BF7EA8|nr:tyrosine-type recombinase/integrase [Metallosphaera sedula]BBL47841.1 integrase [Metallosphaera sedula]
MGKITISDIDQAKRIEMIRRAVETHGMTYVASKLGVDPSTVHRYLSGKIKKVPDQVTEKLTSLLSLDELVDVIHGLRTVDVNPTIALSVIVKANRDEGFRNFFLSLLWQHLGEYLNSSSMSYVVRKEDLDKFEKFLRGRVKVTVSQHMRYLRRALVDLNHELSPDKLKDYMAELMEENVGRARHTAKALKVFIKEVVRERYPSLAQILYTSFKVPKQHAMYTPIPLTLEEVRTIFRAIEGVGAQAFFLILAETGLRTGEVFSLKLTQVDLKERKIRLNKITRTKRALETFLHEETADWIRNTYLPYREKFISIYYESVDRLAQANPGQGIDVQTWRERMFPFREDGIRTDIKEAMRKVLGKEFRLYDLRSFFASHMLKQGVSPMIVNLLQGRASPQQFKILQDHYFTLTPGELREIYEKYAPKLL